jgi:hypothetical protein
LNHAKVSTEPLLEELVERIVHQRPLLVPSLRKEFDRQWGVEASLDSTNTLRDDARKALCREMDVVKERARTEIERLKLAPDDQLGIELLHLLALDLLGRDTPAAKIFANKLEVDFKRHVVTSLFSKRVAAAVLLGLNAFFAVYIVLYASLQGLGWQRQYLCACIVQMVVEIFINETLEAVWINFLFARVFKFLSLSFFDNDPT